MNNKIIDVSKWNAIINYQSVSENVDGVIIRIGWRGYNEGVLVSDPRFLPYIKGLTDKEVPVGVYFNSTAINETEAIDEANFVCDLILSSMCTLSFPIFINSDWSNSDHNGRSDNLSIGQRTAIINAFIDRCSERGYKAGVYATEQWFIEKLNLKNISAIKWVTKLDGKTSIKDNVIAVKYDNKAEIPGIAGMVDLTRWEGPMGAEIIAPLSVPEEVEEIIEEKKPLEISMGASITLSNISLYKVSNGSTIIDTLTGDYFIASNKPYRGRVKIANDRECKKILGWIILTEL